MVKNGSVPLLSARPQYAEQGAQAQQGGGGAQTLRRGEAYGMFVISWFVLIRRLVRVGVFLLQWIPFRGCPRNALLHFALLHFLYY